MKPKQQIDVNIRWMIRGDVETVIDIEEEVFAEPWSEAVLLDCLKRGRHIGMVAEDDHESVVGYMVYEIMRDRLNILRLVVDPDLYRSGIGTQMINRLKDKLSPTRRTRLTILVDEAFLDAQLFLRQMGFKATQVVKERYSNDQYLMEYSIG